MTVLDTQVAAWLASILWPLIRITGLFVAAPLFMLPAFPKRFKALLILTLTLVLAPLLPPAPLVEIFSADALLIGIHQLIIGLVMGFVLQFVFGALLFGAQNIASAIGLSYASMVDPVNGVQTPVMAEVYINLGTLSFLMLDGHLKLIEMLAESFYSLPIATSGLPLQSLYEVLDWARRMFEVGLLMTLPAIGAVLLVNIALGVLSRAAPQLHIFAIGFPIAQLLGFVLLWVTLADTLGNFQEMLDDALLFVRELLRLE